MKTTVEKKYISEFDVYEKNAIKEALNDYYYKLSNEAESDLIVNDDYLHLIGSLLSHFKSLRD